MFDILAEKSKTISKLGSFYYSTVSDKDTAHKLSHVSYLNNILQSSHDMLKSTLGYPVINKKNKVINFTDKDIEYYIFDTKNKSANFIPNINELIQLPKSINGDIAKVKLESGYCFAFRVSIPEDIIIRTIQLSNGDLLINGLNFKSEYGYIIIRDNPIALFDNMSIFALGYAQLQRNILCYPLSLQDVYGDVSFVVDYYKNNQSLIAFKKALMQAIGAPIVLYTSSIIDKSQFKDGCVYTTYDKNVYVVPHKHNQYNVGDTLNKGQVLGADDFIKVYLPTDIIPSDIRAVNIQNMSITGSKDLYVHNIESTLYSADIFQPQNFVNGEGSQYYIDYVNNIGSLQKSTSAIPDKMNCIDFLRNVVANNRCIILDIDKEKIPYDIAIKLKSFIIDHAPIGVVIAEALKAGEVPPIIITTPTSISCFGNESLPDRPFITDSFYLNNVPDTLCELSNGDTLFFDSSISNFWAGATDGSVENTWYNTKAVNQLNEALNLGDNGFTNEDFSQGSFIYYSATGNQGSTSTVTLDVSATAKVGDKIVIMASVASRYQANRGFQITGISDQDIKLGYAGVFGDGFSFVNTNRVEYNPNNTENWSPEKENVNIFMAEGTLTSTSLVLSQPNTNKNGWQFIGYKTSREVI